MSTARGDRLPIGAAGLEADADRDQPRQRIGDRAQGLGGSGGFAGALSLGQGRAIGRCERESSQVVGVGALRGRRIGTKRLEGRARLEYRARDPCRALRQLDPREQIRLPGACDFAPCPCDLADLNPSVAFQIRRRRPLARGLGVGLPLGRGRPAAASDGDGDDDDDAEARADANAGAAHGPDRPGFHFSLSSSSRANGHLR